MHIAFTETQSSGDYTNNKLFILTLIKPHTHGQYPQKQINLSLSHTQEAYKHCGGLFDIIRTIQSCRSWREFLKKDVGQLFSLGCS